MSGSAKAGTKAERHRCELESLTEECARSGLNAKYVFDNDNLAFPYVNAELACLCSSLQLGVTQSVVRNYLVRIYDKVGLSNRVELALWYEARVHEGKLPPRQS
jgi:hypothetical protein